MSDHATDANRRGVFLANDEENKTANSTNFTLRVANPAIRFGLRMDAEAAASIGQVAGFDISQPINRLRQTSGDSGADLNCARLGPDEWLLISQDSSETAENLGARLQADLGDTFHTLVDVSHRNVALELTGSSVPEVLNTGCPLDLGDQAFPVGTATRTLFSKAEIILLRCGDVEWADHRKMPLYRVECWRSFGRYIRAHLHNSAELIGASL